MPPKKDLKRLELQESDTDSDYSPKAVGKKRKKQMRGMISPGTSDTDTGRRKRKRNTDVELSEEIADHSTDVKDNEERQLTYSDIICQTHNLVNVDIDIPDEYLSDISYKQFNKFVRPTVSEVNPKVSGLHITSLVGAKWREFKELYGMDTMGDTPDVERVRNVSNVPSPSVSDYERKDNLASPDCLFNESSQDDDFDEEDEDEFVDEESSNDLKLRMIRRGNKLFRAGDRKTSRKPKKTARQGIVNLDEINLDEVTRDDTDDNSQDIKRKPGPKKRTGPRIKNTKEKKEKKIGTKSTRGGKRGVFKKTGKKDEPVPEPVHNSVCDVCGEGGDILLCDTCTCSWHLTCLDPPLDEVPKGLWSCPKCEEESLGQNEEDEEEETFHGEYCKLCKDGGELLCCDFCPGTYHMRCVKPQLITVPEGEWKCPLCKVDPLPDKVERILFWKFLTHQPTEEEIAAGAKNESYKVRKFFVKFSKMSYWKCHWIDELQLEKYHVSLYRFFCRKNDMNDPPMTEEGTVEGGDDQNVDQLEHERNLDARFYQYGIKPEWLQIQRIFWHEPQKKSKEIKYYVKWKELGYDCATLESRDDPDNKEISDFDKHIEDFNNLRAKYKKKQKQKDKGKSARKKDAWDHDIRPNGYNAEKQPAFITDSGGKLHDYQIAGINWIRYSWGQNENTILADEMGLGKTVQTITFLNSLVEEGRSDGPFLICAPLSTLVNWEREFEFWAPKLYVVSYTGHRENRTVIRNYEMTFEDDGMKKGQKAYKIKKDTMVKFHVLLTSYELVSIDANTLQSIDWKVLVIDEAHRLKNNQSKFFRTMSMYSIGYTLLLTGTPLQNNLEELFHLLNFLVPAKFVNRETFLAEFEDIGKEDQIKKLHEMLGPHMLRRLKADVLKGMPTKSEFIVRVELSEMQKKYYKYILTKNFTALNARGAVQVSLLNVVMELKKCCNHPYLFSTAAAEAPRLPNNAFEPKGLTEASGKLVLLYKMLKKLEHQGHRVLIFSQMTRVLDLLEDFMEGHGWRYERLDGTITGTVRQAAIDRYNSPNSGIFAFLLSTRAGGLGINLATADTVFIYDSDWNPHNDIQAFSRAHRIGQQNKVMIYRFVTKATVEERITQVAKKKMMLTHLVVRPGLGSKAAQSMSKGELDDILKFGTEQMFKDGDDEGRIVYDDKAIASLLDRSNEGIIEKESGMNEYLSSFKVANYTVKDKDEPDVEVLKQDADVIDNDYWEKLLRHHYEQEQEYIASTLGKGKRVRKQVNYNDGALANENRYSKAYDDGSDFDASEFQVDDSDDFSDDEGSNLSARQKKFKERDVLPPLLAKVGTQIEVYGFNPRQRRAFLTAVMRYGLPPKDFKTAKNKWCIHNLRGKTEKAFQAYTSMFLRHLCEPGLDNKIETYSDGVPREGVNRLQVLSRIGVMSLIRRKVEQFAAVNMFLHPVLIGHVLIQDHSMSKLAEECRVAYKLSDEKNGKKPVKSQTENSNKENNLPPNEIKLEIINDVDVTEVKDSMDVTEEQNSMGVTEVKDSINATEVKDSINEVEVKDSINVAEMKDSINVAEVKDSINVAEVKDSINVTEVKDSINVAEVENSINVAEVKDSIDITEVKGAIEREEVRNSSNEKEVKGPMKKKELDKSSDKVEEMDVDSLEEPFSSGQNGSGSGDGKQQHKTNENGQINLMDIDKPANTEDVKEKTTITGENEKELPEVNEIGSIKKQTENGVKLPETNVTSPENKEQPNPKKSEDIKRASPPTSRVVDGVTLPKFMFNISDGGFTELHVLWEAEEKRKLDNIWWRYHDYWLLAGVVVHGYGRWQDILNDVRFDAINLPFARMSVDYKNKFIARRFKLLEQALIVEEQLKRATLMGVEQENSHPAMSLQGRFSELECLAESHQHLSKESLAGNKPANAVLHKVLNQLETLLSDMKNDVTRLPSSLSKMPPVTHRLNMSERSVLTRLASGGQLSNVVKGAPNTTKPFLLSSPPISDKPYLVNKSVVVSPPGAKPTEVIVPDHAAATNS